MISYNEIKYIINLIRVDNIDLLQIWVEYIDTKKDKVKVIKTISKKYF